jgi:hypothetical protein
VASTRHLPGWLTSDIALLTGAGASVPLGLFTTRQFLDDFFDVDAPALTAGDASLHQYVDALRSIAAAENWDVEHLLDWLTQDDRAAERFSSNQIFLMQVVGGSITALGQFRRNTTAVLEALRSKVIEHYSTVNAMDAARLYAPLLQGFAEWFSDVPQIGVTLPFFTLNYDTAIEAAASVLRQPHTRFAGRPVNLVDGLVGDEPGSTDQQWSPRAFTEFEADPSKSNVVLVKLHGSVRWGRRRSGGEIVAVPTAAGRDPGDLETLVVYPTLGDKPLAEEPFHTGYRMFRAAVAKVRVLVCIGTSFRDEELVTEIRDGLVDNPDLRVVAVGPSQAHESLAALLRVPVARVAAFRSAFEFPSHGQYDAEGRDRYSPLMGGLRDLAREALEVAGSLGGARFGATYTLVDATWRSISA